ncbi:MAG: 2,3-bisphosphoglycerate-independent phosphoglycerate mutase [Candidatus Pacebacteria bacterium CG10_big_fil_rev_8_21_14_0_10_56_10]|nr:MAG: 2,3-bisphosphoglycerate-independent phosphoglycerate mutase [Candidatus Pacebacteria bacterium CG10_big_fil_rev_8_21_14_0_10_56_10]
MADQPTQPISYPPGYQPDRNLGDSSGPIPLRHDLTPDRSSAAFNATYAKQSYAGPRPTVLLVLDGWGIGPNNAGNAIGRARTPQLDKLWLSYPHTQLAASGEAVGLPRGEAGNTETGHLNIGAGSIVYQDLPRINMAIADGSFASNAAFSRAIDHVRRYQSQLHIMGLIGSGGVHSNIEHLFALLNLCRQQGLQRVFVHGFTDGRDSPPTAGITYVQQLQEKCSSLGIGRIASLMGRFYAMDRDKRWERIEQAYHTLTLGSQRRHTNVVQAIREQYDQKITDEFIEPVSILDEAGQPVTIADNDAAIFFNFRVDRPRELTKAFVLPTFEQGISQEGFDPYNIKYQHTHIQQPATQTTFQRRKKVRNLYFVTMTEYEEGLPVDVAFPPQYVRHPLGKVLATHGLRQLRMAETEKQRFVTFYLNGQQDDIFPGEDRIILPSKGARSYDQVPEMSAREIGAEMIKNIRQQSHDVIIANLANADMVGHTGNLEATIQACQVIDQVVGQIVIEVTAKQGVVLITADHGNAEEMIDADTGQVSTSHTTNPVPLMIIHHQYAHRTTTLPSGILADVAPTMLKLMGLEQPESMTGRALL